MARSFRGGKDPREPWYGRGKRWKGGASDDISARSIDPESRRQEQSHEKKKRRPQAAAQRGRLPVDLEACMEQERDAWRVDG